MDIAIRAVALYVFIVFLMRIIGRRELSTLTPFDLVLLIVLGDAIQQGLTQDDYSVTGAIIAISTLATMQLVTSFVSYRFKAFRKILKGEPIVLVEDGKLLDRNLRRERLTAGDVAEEMRLQQIATFDEVRWAILESNGTISFVKKAS
ncbi:MAG TPA: YetF domain-containing protein [Streptosporangiaceae bacterium]|jgi:uncharacterized membrane protein YcaP (DUF421 family)